MHQPCSSEGDTAEEAAILSQIDDVTPLAKKLVFINRVEGAFLLAKLIFEGHDALGQT